MRRPAGRNRAAARTRRHPCARSVPVTAPVYDENDPASLAQRMLDQGRYALLLRPQIAANLKKSLSQAASRALDDAMGIVPEGDVLLQSWRHASDRDEADAHPRATGARRGDVPRSLPGDQPAVPAVRGRWRVREHAVVGPDDLAGRARFRRSDGALGTAVSGATDTFPKAWTTIPWWASAGMKARPMRGGRASGCRPIRNG